MSISLVYKEKISFKTDKCIILKEQLYIYWDYIIQDIKVVKFHRIYIYVLFFSQWDLWPSYTTL